MAISSVILITIDHTYQRYQREPTNGRFNAVTKQLRAASSATIYYSNDSE
jgi:hypothetical protein